MEVMMKHNENLKIVAEEHEQLKIAYAEQSQRYVFVSILLSAIFDYLNYLQWHEFCVTLTARLFRSPFRLETSQRSLMAAQDEHKALSDLNEMLRRHNDNLKSQHDW